MCHLPLVLWHSWLGVKKSIWPVKIECWVICLARCADCLHMVQLMPRCSSSSSSCHLWKTPICNTIVIAWSKVYWFNLIPLITTTHTPVLTALFPELPGLAGTRKVKPIWILLKQETVSGRGISWAICKSAPRSRQITTPAPHHSVFYKPGALPTALPTASKHWWHFDHNR